MNICARTAIKILRILQLSVLIVTASGCATITKQELAQMGLPIGPIASHAGPDAEVAGKHAADVFSNPQTLALVQAACHGRLDEVSRLVAKGADVNGIGYRGVSVLGWTMICHNYDGAERLLDLGANPNQKMAGTGDISPMWIAAGSADSRWLPMMLAHGGNPDITVPEIFGTALLNALEQRRFANARLLLSHGADVNERDAAGETAADYAVELQHYGLVEEMLDKGYDYKLQDLANSVDRLKLAPSVKQQLVRERMQLVKRLQRMGFYPERAKFFNSFPPPGLSPYQYHIVLTADKLTPAQMMSALTSFCEKERCSFDHSRVWKSYFWRIYGIGGQVGVSNLCPRELPSLYCFTTEDAQEDQAMSGRTLRDLQATISRAGGTSRVVSCWQFGNKCGVPANRIYDSQKFHSFALKTATIKKITSRLGGPDYIMTKHDGSSQLRYWAYKINGWNAVVMIAIYDFDSSGHLIGENVSDNWNKTSAPSNVKKAGLGHLLWSCSAVWCK